MFDLYRNPHFIDLSMHNIITIFKVGFISNLNLLSLFIQIHEGHQSHLLTLMYIPINIT